MEMVKLTLIWIQIRWVNPTLLISNKSSRINKRSTLLMSFSKLLLKLMLLLRWCQAKHTSSTSRDVQRLKDRKDSLESHKKTMFKDSWLWRKLRDKLRKALRTILKWLLDLNQLSFTKWYTTIQSNTILILRIEVKECPGRPKWCSVVLPWLLLLFLQEWVLVLCLEQDHLSAQSLCVWEWYSALLFYAACGYVTDIYFKF